MKHGFRLLMIGVLALLATACATAVSVTPTSAPSAAAPTQPESTVVPAENAAAASMVGLRFIDSYADW